MVGQKCAIPSETAVEAITLFEDKVTTTSERGEKRKYSCYIMLFNIPIAILCLNKIVFKIILLFIMNI